ncbi:hypothetical protein [Curtobacterium sp. SORGH_AS_0776]|jgi:hypothetical protein|uniref:hypothetical protein n=1 Tax=Curtobacterium sp. SORGH_AS_0776 TaxID=3041798 RepID=UPI00285FB82F|nr:hypothetical protein [Curtobacterium sp. SORGH_AS_0776]MDR6170338.1 hypothetical protein [Curtobacterium sp. SORGH_AS_0776]
MSSTPLFDSIARRAERPTPAPAAPAAPSAPTSPMTAPVEPQGPVFVPASLVAAIEAIPTRVVAATTAHAVAPEQLVLVEAVADAITRAVVDAVVTELERIARDGVVRA